MALSLNKCNNILNSTDEENKVSIKDHEKTSINISTQLSDSFSSFDTSNMEDVSLSNHEFDVEEPSSKKKKKKKKKKNEEEEKKKKTTKLFRLRVVKEVNVTVA